MVYTTGVCYHCSLVEREEYRKHILTVFRNKYRLSEGEKTYLDYLQALMSKVVDNCGFEQNPDIAKNSALVENIFMMVICIELKIPLFLVGKPGSSKSLSKTIVNNAMQRKASTNEFFQDFKQIQMLSFQCSPHTTTKNIFDVFQSAVKLQKDKNLDEYTSVVVLDEIGLAEDSQTMPLKSLHPLLELGFVEEGCEATSKNKVAFIGISNWALDPAKMNRGILVNRPVPGKNELLECAKSMCRVHTEEGKVIKQLIEPLTDAFLKITTGHGASVIRKEYFGLRDFYSLLKMIYRNEAAGWSKLRYCIQRNFAEKGTECMNIFKSELSKAQAVGELDDQVPDTLALVKDNLRENFENLNQNATVGTKMDQTQCESRYLLLMIEKFTALQLLPEFLDASKFETIFGSAFPDDQVYIQACRNINQIKHCMETGKNLILINLGLIYESLYDALNQYYFFYCGKRYVDLGLGSDRVKCSVAPSFRLIIIEEEETALQLPIPLLNRLEKHFLNINSTLSRLQISLKNSLEQAMDTFSLARRSDKDANFNTQQVFVGFQADTLSLCIKRLTDQDCDAESVVNVGMTKMMQTCTLDAIWRKSQDTKYIPFGSEIYQIRNNLSNFLWHYIYQAQPNTVSMFEISTFCKIPSPETIKQWNKELIFRELPVFQASSDSCNLSDLQMVVNLAKFKTEQQFTDKMSEFHQRASGSGSDSVKILFVICADMYENSKLIRCAKNCIELVHREKVVPKLFTVFITQLPRNWHESSYSNFATAKWESFHIDNLDKDNETSDILKEIYISTPQNNSPEIISILSTSKTLNSFQRQLLKELVQDTVADMEEKNKVDMINMVFQLFRQEKTESQVLLESVFLEKVVSLVKSKNSSVKVSQFVKDAASNFEDLIRFGTVEQVFFEKLKQYLKPFAQDFLEMINFKLNYHFLSEDSWKKQAWIDLFCVAGICDGKIGQTKAEHLGKLFPFFGEILKRFSFVWEEAVEMQKDSDATTKECFLERFENNNPALNEVLIKHSSTPDAVECFCCELVTENFLKIHNLNSDHLHVIKECILSISTSDRNASFQTNYSIFQELLSSLRSVLPIFQKFTPISKSVVKNLKLHSGESFVASLLEAALGQITFSQELKREIGWGQISEQAERAAVLKMCITIDQKLSHNFRQKLRAADLGVTFLYRISYNLQHSIINKICKNACVLFQYGANTGKFLNNLQVCLEKPTMSFVVYCVKEETGSELCAICGGKLSSESSVPCLVKCQSNHAAHRACVLEKRSSLSSEQCDSCEICRTPIRHSDCEMENSFQCHSPPLKRSWSQFWQNIASTFMQIVYQHMISTPNAQETSVIELFQFCVFKSKSIWVSTQIRSCLLSVILTSYQQGAIEALSRAVKEAPEASIDSQECEKIIASAFDYCYENDCFNQKIISEIHTSQVVRKLQYIAECKYGLRRIVDGIQGRLSNDTSFDNQIGEHLQELQRLDGNSRENASKYFLRYVNFKLGTFGLNEVLREEIFRPLIPPSVINLESFHGDIYLSFAGYFEVANNVYAELEKGSSDKAFEVLLEKSQFLQCIFAYRYIIDDNSSSEVEVPALRSVFRQNLIQTQINSIYFSKPLATSRAPQNVDSSNCLEHFAYLFQAFSETELKGKVNNLFIPFRLLMLTEALYDSWFLPCFKDSYEYYIKMYKENGYLTDEQLRTATLNECPNGHLYIVEDCGRPWKESKCSKCGATIGGRRHEFAPGNRKIADLSNPENLRNQTKFTGYLKDKSDIYNRNVTQLTSNLMQFFLHLTLYIVKGDQEMLDSASVNLTILAADCFDLCQEDTLKILINFLESSLREPVKNCSKSFETEEGRACWEDLFASFAHKTLSDLDVQKVINDYNHLVETSYENRRTSQINSVLFERKSTDSIESQQHDPWQVRRIETWSSFSAQLNRRPSTENVLLRSLLSNQTYLNSIAQLSKLYNLFAKLTELYNSQESGHNKSFEQFLSEQRILSTERRELTDASLIYIDIWNSIIRKLSKTETVECEFRDELSSESSVKHFVIIEPANECCALATFKFLVQKNNEIVQGYRQLIGTESRFVGKLFLIQHF